MRYLSPGPKASSNLDTTALADGLFRTLAGPENRTIPF